MKEISEALVLIALISLFPTCNYIKSQERIALKSIKQCNTVTITNLGKK